MLGVVGTAVKRFASRVLDLDESPVRNTPQYQLMFEATRNNHYDLDVAELKELVSVLKKKHVIESVLVAYQNGSLILSSNGQDVKEAIKGTALYSYVRSEIPKSTSILIKADDWYMLHPFNKKIYIVRATASLSYPELKAISEDIESFLGAKNAEAL